MSVAITRRAAIAGCLAGFGLIVLPAAASASSMASEGGKPIGSSSPSSADDEASESLEYEKEEVLFAGLSIELPIGNKFESAKESSEGLNLYSGIVNDDIRYKVVLCDVSPSTSGTWAGASAEELMSATIRMKGYTRIGEELYKGDGVDTALLYYYYDAAPELNDAKAIVFGAEQTWELEIGTQSDSGDDESALKLIAQIASSIKLDDAVGQEKRGALKRAQKQGSSE